jgi:mono/diheme cytochrome c family protein
MHPDHQLHSSQSRRWPGLLAAVLLCVSSAAFAAAPGESASALDTPTFVHDVAPILHQNCASCHQPGEIAPMALRSYDEVRPWAKSIAKAVQNRDMPPWDADPGFGPFTNDISLSQDEIDTIVRWTSAGAPRGEGAEPVLDLPKTVGDWKLGEPDWTYEFDSFEVAADGSDQFKIVSIETGWEDERWIKAIEILPGDPTVVHHFILWRADEANRGQDAWLGGWAAGAPPAEFPEGTARRLPAGRNLLGDFHYHPSGNAATDRTRIGVHFAEPEEIEKEYVNLWVLNAGFKIPAGDPNYQAKASYVFPQDVAIRSLAPHMHYRGKDMKYTAYLPDGSSRELLSVSRYDFNWQTGYDFEEPVDLPAGTKVEVIAHWDNSADNPSNPDPTKDVGWGTDSTDEMLIGFVDYVVKDGISPKPISLVLGKLAELAEAYPGQVWRFDIQQGPEAELEPSAVHLPKDGSQGGWYVQMGSLVLPAPIKEVVWDGNAVTAKAYIPGQQPTEITGTLDTASGKLELSMGGGAMTGTPAEDEARQQGVPNG